LLIYCATISLGCATSLTGEVGVTVVNYCVLLQVAKNKLLEKQEENMLDKLQKKACSLQKVSTYHHQCS
jgi:hypothetical protein